MNFTLQMGKSVNGQIKQVLFLKLEKKVNLCQNIMRRCIYLCLKINLQKMYSMFLSSVLIKNNF